MKHVLRRVVATVVAGMLAAPASARPEAHAQSSAPEQLMASDTRVRGYWVDPLTALMWAGRDNFGRDLNWRQATKYCRDLRLAGYSDWRLATIDELEGIYDRGARALGRGGQRSERPQAFHVKGDLSLTGLQWSASRSLDPDGRPTGWAYRFDFFNGGRFEDELHFHDGLRALCVRANIRN
jgi:Protein of unknown function (DUF1566)